LRRSTVFSLRVRPQFLDKEEVAPLDSAGRVRQSGLFRGESNARTYRTSLDYRSPNCARAMGPQSPISLIIEPWRGPYWPWPIFLVPGSNPAAWVDITRSSQGRRTYFAPERFRGRTMRLADGWVLASPKMVSPTCGPPAQAVAALKDLPPPGTGARNRPPSAAGPRPKRRRTRHLLPRLSVSRSGRGVARPIAQICPKADRTGVRRAHPAGVSGTPALRRPAK